MPRYSFGNWSASYHASPHRAVEPWSWLIMCGAEAEAVVRLAEALVARPADELRDRLGVAVGGVEVEPRVEGHAERVHLPAGEDLDAAAVRAEAERVARTASCISWPSLPFTVRVVGEAVAGVDPAVGHQRERVDHAVRVADAEAREQHLRLVGLAVAVGVGQFQISTAISPAGPGRCSTRCTLLQSGSGRMPMGMFRSSANVCTLRALPVRAEVGEDEQLVGRLAGRGRERVVVRRR